MRLAFCLSVRAFTNPPVGQALSTDATKQFGDAHRVVDPERDAVRVAEIELGEVAVKVSLADAVERARSCGSRFGR